MAGRVWRYSFSQLETYEQCARKYLYAYVERRPRGAPSVEAFLGMRVHEIAERIYKWLDAGKSLPTITMVEDRLTENWNAEERKLKAADVSAQLTVAKAGATVEDYFEIGLRAVRNLHAEAEQDVAAGLFGDNHAHLIETRVEFQAGKVPMMGYVDRFHFEEREDGAHGTVHDYKTSARPKSQADVDADHQLRLYAMGVRNAISGLKSIGLRWHFLAVGNGAIVDSDEKGNGDTVEWVESTVAELSAKDRGVKFQGKDGLKLFPSNPSILCRWCNARSYCPDAQS